MTCLRDTSISASPEDERPWRSDDPVAAAAVINESVVTFEPVRIDVELSGHHTRGRTVVNSRPDATPNASIGTKADADQIRAMALNALKRAAA